MRPSAKELITVLSDEYTPQHKHKRELSIERNATQKKKEFNLDGLGIWYASEIANL